MSSALLRMIQRHSMSLKVNLFLNTSEKIQYLSLTDVLTRILSSVWNKALNLYSKSEELVMEIIQTTMKGALALIRPGVLAKCES